MRACSLIDRLSLRDFAVFLVENCNAVQRTCSKRVEAVKNCHLNNELEVLSSTLFITAAEVRVACSQRCFSQVVDISLINAAPVRLFADGYNGLPVPSAFKRDCTI